MGDVLVNLDVLFGDEDDLGSEVLGEGAVGFENEVSTNNEIFCAVDDERVGGEEAGGVKAFACDVSGSEGVLTDEGRFGTTFDVTSAEFF